MAYPSSPAPQAKSMKGQLKCFQCRQTIPTKDGEWQNWKNMQVFLCKPCDAKTVGRPERAK